MTQQQRYRYYSALQSKKARVFRFGVLEALTDLQLRLVARALNLPVEESAVDDWAPPPIALRQQHQAPATATAWTPPAVALRK